MHMKKLKKLRFDEDTGALKIAGENGFGKDKTVYVDVENPELFLNAIKSAFQMGGKDIELTPE
ncbi:hypothetical protein CU102_03795 [Phyllobacterium brassicacearum]|uniref:Uncharacterized protein n=1 Tax=Phyllobacterium brassicacearum TaxID=314235 RepID=A0A2P7BUY7_9HYPH|nr:hypothetical protein [Phyllobacterium brassicacearum]PSH70222.1 hypothetical protein CU102_03795 [Phyllobacterium brassicacearum]TDQ33890.1 hypothetical protein DEV91_10493 [Phyllobacterium brassicacearum]